MKILIITKYFWPERFLINDIVLELSKKHDVTVITGTPNYFYKSTKDFNINDVHSMFPNVDFHYVSVTNRNGSAYTLLRNYFDFPIKTRKFIKEDFSNFDVVYVYQLSPINIAKTAVEIAKKYKKPLFLYCLDIWPESAKAKFGRFKFLYKLITKKSSKIYESCDYIGVTSKSFLRYINNLCNFPLSKMAYLPQHGSEEMVNLPMEKERGNIINFLYAGNLGNGQRIDVLIDAFYELSKLCHNFIFTIIGTGTCENKLKSLTNSLNLTSKVRFVGSLDRKETIAYYKEADALVFSLRGNNEVGNTLPGKIQTYLTVGKPIFGCANGSSNELINSKKLGCVVPAEDSIKLSAVLKDFIDNPLKYYECGTKAKQLFLESFTLRTHIDNLENILSKLVNEYENED